jgi:predicted dinucleotide-binding enzyme
MNIGVIGAGHIGATLARKLAVRGHTVELANSKEPESVLDLAREVGATAVTKEEAVQAVDVIIERVRPEPDRSPLIYPLAHFLHS